MPLIFFQNILAFYCQRSLLYPYNKISLSVCFQTAIYFLCWYWAPAQISFSQGNEGLQSPAKGWSLLPWRYTMCQVWSSVSAAAQSGVSNSGSSSCDSSTECPPDGNSLLCRDIPVPALPATQPRKASPPSNLWDSMGSAWQSACTHTRLNAAVGARMRSHKLPGQFPVTHLVLPSVPPGVQSHGLKADTGTGWESKGNSSLKCL